ncbi:MAG: hypothetical protein ABIQ99_12225 [Thermoflexales bacterium]
MQREGPPLEALTRRLAETPGEFLAEPRIGRLGSVNVAAVIADLMLDLGAQPLSDPQAGAFTSADPRKDRNRLSLTLITAWLLRDDALKEALGGASPAERQASLLGVLTENARELAELTQAPRFVADPDRREELVRFALKGLALRPAGESVEQAQDRLATLNTAERQRVIVAARAAEERARAVREAMARKAAEEAAAKYNRE